MMKALSSIVAVLSLLLVFSPVFAAPAAPDYTLVGVKLGDTAVYRSNFTYSGDNKTTVSIYGLVGTVVYLNYTTYNPSGSVDTTELWPFDFEIGAPPSYRYFLVAANLTVGDPIYFGAAQLVETTTTMTIAGAARSVNHLSDGSLEVWWDRATGLMVELHLPSIGWCNYTLISTDSWSPYAPPSLFDMTTIALVEGVIIIVLLIALVLVAVRRGKSRSKK